MTIGKIMRGVARCGLIAFGSATIVVNAASAQTPDVAHGSSHEAMRWQNTLFLLFNQLEYSGSADERPVNVDARAWYGGAHQRIWLRGQSDFATTKRQGEVEAQVLYGRLVDPFWDAVVGVRVDQHWGDAHRRRTQLAIGFLGLAPYRLELEPTVFISSKGEISARFEAGFDFLITQRLVAEPEVEFNAALQAVPAFDIRRGLNDYEAGIRFRYEFRREIAPYVGWSRSRRISGSTGSSVSGGPVSESRLVAGLRLWR